MKDNFLTIPCAPNYEINSDFVCRNKTTGKILKLRRNNRGIFYYLLFNNLNGTKHEIKRSPKHLRAQAVAASKVDSFEPIPSSHNQYEINTAGTVRNALTKRVLKPLKDYQFHLCDSKGAKPYQIRSRSDLLWEVFGIIPKTRQGKKIPCSAENNHGKFIFDSIRACARFLAPKLHYSFFSIEYKIRASRLTFIGEWRIELQNNIADVHYDFHNLNVEAKRAKRAWDDAQKKSPIGG